jgi:hypothetical protein
MDRKERLRDEVELMVEGLSDAMWIPFHDAEQWLACGQSVSANRNWLYEEELGLQPLIDQCQREMRAAGEGAFPFAPIDIGGNPRSIVATLDRHRPNWPPSGQALYDSAIAAVEARTEKDAKLRDANRQIREAWLGGKLALHGRPANDPAAAHAPIDPLVARPDPESGAVEVEISIASDERSDLFLNPVSTPSGLSGIAKRPAYRDILVERNALIDLAANQFGTESKADTGEAAPANEPKKRKRPGIDTAREAIAALWPNGVPTGLTYNEIETLIRQWCQERKPSRRPPSDRTIRRALTGT